MNNPRSQLGSILQSHGVISEEQLGTALAYQKERGCGLGEALLELTLCSEVDVARALAEQNDIPFVDFNETPPSPQALRLIAREVAVEYGIVPVRVEGRRLLVAARNPYDFRIDEVIRNATRMTVVVASAAEGQLRDLLGRYEQLKYQQPTLPPAPSPGGVYRPGASAAPNRWGQPGQGAASEQIILPSEMASTVRKVNSLIADAVRRRARDIFFEPGEDGLRVRCRIDGVLHPLTTVPAHEMAAVTSRLAAMTGINLLQAHKSQTGRCDVRIYGESVELRAGVMGGVAGAILVLRNAKTDAAGMSLEDLGLEPAMLLDVRKLLAARRGMVLVAGPVGSGHTATLYALADQLHLAGLHVFALEGSFERKLSGISRLQPGDHSVQSFSSALATALGQKPDVVLVGDLPDKDTAEIACRAAATGQMLLVGSFVPDALSAISRILELGINPPHLGSAITGVLAQRLVRRVCEKCARKYRVPFQLQLALKSVVEFPDAPVFRKGRGCEDCNRIGHRGQVGVFELLVADEDMQSLVSQRVAPSVLRQHAGARGFRTMEEDAFDKACRGLIQADEILSLGGAVAVAMEEVHLKAGISAPEAPEALEEEEEPVPVTPTVPDLPELVTWEEVADMAKLLDD